MSVRLRSFFWVSICAALGVAASLASAAPALKKSAVKKEANSEPAAKVITAMSTPLRSGHPTLFLLSGEEDVDRTLTRLHFPPDQRYSKWSVIFDAPIKIESIEVETCGGTKPFSDGVELFLDYNQKRLFSDGGRKIVKFKVGASARTLTLGFLESQGLCLDRIAMKTTGEWLRPRIIAAIGNSVIADGAIGLSPRTVPDGKKIKPLGVGKSERKPGEWLLSWDNPLIVESIRIWNGNQSPGDSFSEYDRVRELDIRADGAKPVRTSLEDRRYSQQIDLADVRAIRTLELKSVSSYPGSLATEPMLSEIQLSAGGETWIPVIPSVSTSETIAGESLQAAVVRERGYGDILDRELRTDDSAGTWKFRFRSDGTFFARVFIDRARISKAWSVSGAWRLLEKPAKIETPDSPQLGKNLVQAFGKTGGTSEPVNVPGLAISLVGTKIATADSIDSLPCASHCFPYAEDRGPTTARPARPASQELPVSEQIELQRLGRSLFFIRNRTEQEKQTMEFRDLKVRINSLYD